MKYGDFDQANREYVIHRPDTPAPWRNYLGNGAYRAVVSHTGGGYSYDRDPVLLRVLRDRPRALPEDRPGRYLYVRERETGEYWSPTWQPVMAELDSYEGRHGMGYTTVRSSRHGIAAEVTYLIPLDEHLELWVCTLRNDSERARALNLFTYAEFSLWGVLKDLLGQQASKYVGMVHFEDGAIIHDTRSDSAGPKGEDEFVLHRAYFGCGRPLAGYDVQREEFIGGPWRDEGRPLAVERGSCSGKQYYGYDPIASLHLALELAPGQEETIVFVLGVDDEGTEWRGKLAHYTQPENARQALAGVKAYWARHLDGFQIDTPDAGMNAIFNAWDPYQTVNTFLTPRGYRDSSQDVLGIVHMLPKEVRQRLLVLLSHEFQNGATTHDYSPDPQFSVLKDGVMRDGDVRFGAKAGTTLEEQFGSRASDPPLWVAPAVNAYVKETGDFSLLKETLPFLDGGEAGVLDHLQRILDCSWNRRGLYGLTALAGDGLERQPATPHGRGERLDGPDVRLVGEAFRGIAGAAPKSAATRRRCWRGAGDGGGHQSARLGWALVYAGLRRRRRSRGLLAMRIHSDRLHAAGLGRHDGRRPAERARSPPWTRCASGYIRPTASRCSIHRTTATRRATAR